MKDVIRYSESFKRQIVREMEQGVHPNCFSAAKAYGIRGVGTVSRWVSEYGKAHLLKKVLRVETKEERNELTRLREQVRELKSALVDAHLDLRLEKAFLEMACESAGIDDVEAFKKKADVKLSKGRLKNRLEKEV